MSGIAGDPVSITAEAPAAPEGWAASASAPAAPQADWLAQFNDPVMESLVAEALAANPGLESRYYAVQAARAAAQATYGRTLPNISASASAGATSNYFEGASFAEGEDGPVAVTVSDRSTDPTFGLGLDASWQADLWGRVGAGVEAARSDLDASEADLAAAQLSVAAQTAIAWINLNEAVAQEQVAVQTLDSRVRTKDITERRFARGVADALEVRTARSAIASAEAAIASRQQFTGNAVRSLEVLAGRYPANALEAPAVLPQLDPIVPISSPMDILARRPDISASEARVVSAGLRAEQARLALLPSLQLTASLSSSDTDLADAFDPQRIAARAIAGLTAPLFNGGSLAADRDAALSRARGSMADYASTVLAAWSEVEDALAADAFLARQEDAQLVALDEAIEAEDLATRQYTNGLITIFNLIDAQNRRLSSESNLISARSARASNRIRYHLALGGGVPVAPAATDVSPQTP